MNALRVHGGGAVFANISANLGRIGQYGPEADDESWSGIATLNGREL